LSVTCEKQRGLESPWEVELRIWDGDWSNLPLSLFLSPPPFSLLYSYWMSGLCTLWGPAHTPVMDLLMCLFEPISTHFYWVYFLGYNSWVKGQEKVWL
jgi:hypothetical protein